MSRLLQEIKALEQKHLIRNQFVWGDETRGGSGVEACSRLVKSIYLERCDIIRTISLSGKPQKTRVVLRIEPSGGLTGVKAVKVKREKCVISLVEHFQDLSSSHLQEKLLFKSVWWEMSLCSCWSARPLEPARTVGFLLLRVLYLLVLTSGGPRFTCGAGSSPQS